MTEVSPFHSTEPDIVVYHDNDECDVGNNIEPENLSPGTGGHRLCSRCEELDSE